MLPTICNDKPKGLTRIHPRGFRYDLKGVPGGFPGVSEGFLIKSNVNTKPPQQLHPDGTLRKSGVSKTDRDAGKSPTTTEDATAEGFPSVPADPLYIIRRGIHVEKGVRLCCASF